MLRTGRHSIGPNAVYRIWVSALRNRLGPGLHAIVLGFSSSGSDRQSENAQGCFPHLCCRRPWAGRSRQREYSSLRVAGKLTRSCSSHILATREHFSGFRPNLVPTIVNLKAKLTPGGMAP